MDAFICGVCRCHFDDVDTFLSHKRLMPSCHLLNNRNSTRIIDRNDGEELQIEVTEADTHKLNLTNEKSLISSGVADQGEIVLENFHVVCNGSQFEGTSEMDELIAKPRSSIFSIGDTDKVGRGEEANVLPGSESVCLDGGLKNTPLSIFTCRLCNHYALQEVDVMKHLLVQHGKIVVTGSNERKSYILKLPPLQSPVTRDLITLKEVVPDSDVVQLQLIRGLRVDDSNETTFLSNNGSNVSSVVKDKKRRGRPKKGAVKKQTEESEDLYCTKQKRTGDNVELLLSADGFYRCDRCNRSFRKERQIRGHRCFAFEPKYDNVSLRESCKINIVDKSMVSVSDGIANSMDNEFNRDESEEPKDDDDRDGESVVVPQRLKHVPVFLNDEDRAAFKRRLNAVDLKFVDHLYSKHVIEQQIKYGVIDDKNKSKLQSANCKQLHIFSCNVCNKVFKSVSRIRLHCLVHTDLKPFRCTDCSYASNTKGNLYTHVRKHTGNIYRCPHCEFRSCNRSHVIEHEATHSVQQRHTCRICNNQYRTFKSLGNHVRKYHTDSLEDCDYVASFSSSKFTGNLLHECQICHRKFKEKIDKERHLRLHNVDGSQHVFNCELCPYKTSRSVYLERHFGRHRLIYSCCRCTEKFLSLFLLKQHLRCEHLSDEMDYAVMLTESVESSWFLDVSGSLFDDRCSNDEDGKLVLSSDEAHIYNETFIDNDESDSVADGVVLRMIKRLKYKRISSETYEVIRKTFGKEECGICGGLFHSVDDLLIHERCHVRETRFKCQKCNYSAATGNNLERHVETFHEQRSYACGSCQHVSRSRTSLWQHQQKHKRVTSKCHKCEKTFTNRTKLRQHLDLVHTNVDCRASTVRSSNEHIRRSWFGKHPLKCPHCDRIFHRSISDLKKHIWIHEGIKPFKCSICSYTCRSRNNLNVHMLRHSDDKPERCLECDKSYKSKTALRWHQNTHKKNHFDTRRNQLKQQLEAGVVFKKTDFTLNDVDGEVTISSSSISIDSPPNSVVNDGTVSLTNSEEVKVYKCFNCDSFFEGLSDMTHHLKVKHNLPAKNLTNLGLTELQLINKANEGEEETTGVINDDTNELCMMAANYEDTENVAAATVNVIRQIIDQGGLETGHLTLHAVPEGLQLAMNPETFIIHGDDGRAEVVVGGSLENFEGQEVNGMTVEEECDQQSSKYTIQFVTEPRNEFLS